MFGLSAWLFLVWLVLSIYDDKPVVFSLSSIVFTLALVTCLLGVIGLLLS